MMIFLAIVLIAGLMMYAVIVGSGKSKNRGKKGGRGAARKVNVKDKWALVKVMSTSGPAGLKNAISEADKLFDYVMKQQGYPGDTMADRLRHAQRELSDRNAVWQAHRLRNALAHEVGFDLVPTQAKGAILDFEQGLKDLGAL